VHTPAENDMIRQPVTVQELRNLARFGHADSMPATVTTAAQHAAAIAAIARDLDAADAAMREQIADALADDGERNPWGLAKRAAAAADLTQTRCNQIATEVRAARTQTAQPVRVLPKDDALTALAETRKRRDTLRSARLRAIADAMPVPAPGQQRVSGEDRQFVGDLVRELHQHGIETITSSDLRRLAKSAPSTAA
jgi:hypothetical protein